MSKALIGNIKKDSIAYDLGLSKGDYIVKVNNRPIGDIIDYIIETSDNYIELLVEKGDGELFLFEIDKYFNEDLGIHFNPPTITPIKTCQNNCMFCFINQMPPGLRDSLYIKDDDYRLSFLNGNYITGTNLDNKDIERIMTYNLSPLYISVHQTDINRDVLMGRKKTFSIMKMLRKLKDGGIFFHTQIVLVPGFNDGNVLKNTLKDLNELRPNILSVAIVPVGLTKYRDDLPKINQVNKNVAIETINIANQFNKKRKDNIVFVSDEIFLKAKLDIPESEYYNDYSQLENGIGMLRLFKDEFEDALEELEKRIRELNFEKKFILITSEITNDYLSNLMKKFQELNEKFQYEIVAVKNNFFGDSVNVTGLLVGNDILSSIDNNKEIIDNNSVIMLSEDTLNFENRKFLDGLTFDKFKKEIENEVVLVEVNGKIFVEKILKEGVDK